MLLLLLLSLTAADGARPVIPWERDHGAASTAAEEKGAPLLIHFRSDDCERTAVGGSGHAGSVPGSVPETARSVSGVGGRSIGEAGTDCDAMEEMVWSNPAVVAAASRFVPVLTGDTSDRTLTRRYEAATMPTTLIADPWGNEIVRLVHYVDATRVIRILNAIPQDFSGLSPVARALRRDPSDAEALLKAAAFYEGARLPEIAEKYYERTAAGEAARKDAGLRSRLAVVRGTNLLRMGKSADASQVFRAAFENTPDAPQSDTILFGWMMAELQQNRVKEADQVYRELFSRFPESKYAVRAKENMAAAKKN